MDSISDAAQTPNADGVTGLVGTFEDAKTLAAILEHLGHEGHGIEPAVMIECPKNFFAATNLNDFAGEKI